MENKNLTGRKSPATGETAGKKTGKTTNKRTRSKGNGRATGKKTTKTKKKSEKKGGLLSKLIMLFAFGVLAVSIYQIITMILPYYSGGKEYDEVKELAVAEPGSEEEEGEDEEPADTFVIDFEALSEINPDTVAWIRLEEPAIISYPVVKSRDNEEYLTRTFSANDNKLGAIFLDKRCHSSFSDKNSIIYGHNLKVGGEMFSQLSAYADAEFCQQHPYFYLYLPDGTTKVYQVFSAGVVKATAENYNVDFNTNEDFQRYLEICKNSSNYQVDVDLNTGSRIVSLSTCTNVLEDERFLVQGVLVEER